MTWTRLSDDFNDRPELLNLSRTARLLHVEGLVYSNRLLTDGQIPRAALHRFSDSIDLDSDVAELEQAGLWVATDVPPGWQIARWADPAPMGAAQEPREAVLKRQEDTRTRKERSRLHHDGDHSKCLPKYCPKGPRTQDGTRTVTRDQTQDGTQAVTTSPPDPARPAPKVGGTRRMRCDNGEIIPVDGHCCDACDADKAAAQKRASQ